MDQGVTRIYQFLIIGGIALLLFILAFSTPILMNTTDFSMFNAGWNGCSDIAVKTYKTGSLLPTFSFEENDMTLIQHSFVNYPLDSLNSTIVIIGPGTVFSKQEGEYIGSFLKDGGKVLLADDFGTGNDLLEKLNASSRFSGDLMLDLSFEKNASFVTIFDFQNTSSVLGSNVSHILLDYPTSLTVGRSNNTTVLAVSTQVSWLDVNLNGKEDVGEPSGPFPVLVTERYGKGTLVLLSDPSVLINSLRDQLDNSQFRDALFRYLYADRTTVIIDESHRPVFMSFSVAYLFPSSVGLEVKVSIVLLVIGAFIVGFTGIPRYLLHTVEGLVIKAKVTPEEPSSVKMIDEIIERHPSWSRKKLEEIVKELR